MECGTLNGLDFVFPGTSVESRTNPGSAPCFRLQGNGPPCAWRLQADFGWGFRWTHRICCDRSATPHFAAFPSEFLIWALMDFSSMLLNQRKQRFE
jgi:hypothetical protein